MGNKKKEKDETKKSKAVGRDRLKNVLRSFCDTFLVIPTALSTQADDDVPKYAIASDMTDEEKQKAIRKNLVGDDKSKKDT